MRWVTHVPYKFIPHTFFGLRMWCMHRVQTRVGRCAHCCVQLSLSLLSTLVSEMESPTEAVAQQLARLTGGNPQYRFLSSSPALGLQVCALVPCISHGC